MKQALSVFGVSLVIVLAFVLGMHTFSSSHIAVKPVKPKNVCVGKNACVQGPLSVFSKELFQKSLSAAQKPSGFCLSVPVLLYHHIQPQADAIAKGQTSLTVDSGIFDQQMAYLASNGYTTLSAKQLVDAILSHSQLPAKSIVVTLDDGYLDNYLYAYQSLKKYHLVGNLMVPTGLLGANAGTNTYFTWDNLKEMVGGGTMFAYDHTWSHFAMAAGPKEKDTYEAQTAQQQLLQNLGSAAPIFVYPYGSGQTLGWVQQLIKQNGFVAAFSTLPGRFQCEGNIFALPRLHIGNAPLSSYGI